MDKKQLDKIYCKCTDILKLMKNDSDFDDVREDMQRITREILEKAKNLFDE